MEEKKSRKVIHCIQGSNLRDIVNYIRENNIPKEDLWYIDKDRGQYSLLFYK